MDRRNQFALLIAAATGAAIVGYQEFRFLTDDAYISFRYASNLLAGRGLVWNPAPFLPVEGYTNFAWVVLLSAVWAATGIAPPDAANPISLAFGISTLALLLWMGLRMQLPASYERFRVPLLALVAVGVVGNRTWLAWLSSGLETAMFNFALTAWVGTALGLIGGRGARAALSLTGAASLAALTRPDGWLAVAACVPLALLAWRNRALAIGWAWTPLLLPIVHVVWRRSYYGEWLPNTWFAKHVGAWPESGVRYAVSFALEYALWIWVGLAILWLLRRPRPGAAPAIVLGVLLGHFAFYTFVIGGDHFEYRVFSHLIGLLFLSALWLLGRLGARPVVAAAVLGAFVVLSWPIPWTHHFATRDLATRADTLKLFVPTAPRLAPPLRWLAEAFDAQQAWLIPRLVGLRHREHAAFHDLLDEQLPPRSEGAKIGWDRRAVVTATNVGVLGWRFPNAAVLDALGLNDYVIARSPAAREHAMAHSRRAPPGYLKCYRPNLRIEPTGGYSLLERAKPLRDEDIARCETTWRARVGGPA